MGIFNKSTCYRKGSELLNSAFPPHSDWLTWNRTCITYTTFSFHTPLFFPPPLLLLLLLMTTQLSNIDRQYQKALRSFLLKKYTTAASATLKAIADLAKLPQDSLNVGQLEQLRFSIWTLYLNVTTILLTHNTPSQQLASLVGLSASAAKNPEHFVLAIWQLLSEGYSGPGNVDPRLVCAW